MGVVVSINTSSSITVSWSPPVGGTDGHVIIYSTSAEGPSTFTQLVEGGNQTSFLLTGLSEGHLYTIRMFAYRDLPSLQSDHVQVMLDSKRYIHDTSALHAIFTLHPYKYSNHKITFHSSWSSVQYQCYDYAAPN